jgi:hypothetical protein
MKTKRWLPLVALVAPIAFLAAGMAQAETSAPESPAIVVDKVVAHPEKFKGTINVTGRVAKVASTNALFALSCEDACFSMPVRFSGTPPPAGSEVIVRGQITKDTNGRYVFDAKSVTAKK